MSKSSSWKQAAKCLWGAAVLLSLAAPARGAGGAQAGGTAVLPATTDALRAAAGGAAVLRTASDSGLGIFLSLPRDREIPAAGATAPDRALAFIDDYGAAFGLRGRDELRLIAAERDELGMDHVRYQQTYAGVPVTAAEVVVHLRDAGVSSVSAKTIAGITDLRTVPSVTAADAAAAALAAVGKQRGGSGLQASAPRLEVFAHQLLGGPARPPRLAWFVEVSRLDVREYVWIDAARGGVILSFSQLTDALNRSIYTANDLATLPGTLLRSEGGAPVPGTNPNSADANAAYDYSGDTYEYFWTQHARNSYDGKGAALRSTVHFCPTPTDCPYENAFWNGTQMVYGEGFSLADDVDAHELTHAVTEKSANLLYYMQSGALNESFSDIFGESVDLLNGAGDDDPAQRWLVGEEVPVFGAMRDMWDPNAFGDPARTGDPLYSCDYGLIDSGGVHTNSGVPNHFFALLADGGSYNGEAVDPLGLEKAGKVAYRALTRYLTSGSNFVDAYHAFRQSCDDLVGTAGITVADCGEVQNALDAVEMDQPVCGLPAEPALCPAGEGPVTVFRDDLEKTASGNWSTGWTAGGNVWLGGAGTPGIYFTGYARSGKYSLWGWDADVTSTSFVRSKAVAIPAGARLAFKHYYNFDPGYDGGVLEYAADGGAWTDALALHLGGANYATDALIGTGDLSGRRAFTGWTLNYGSSLYDLSSLAGSNVRFQFLLATDFSGGADGWLIDDVLVYTCDGGGEVQLSAASYAAAEASPTVTVTVSRSNGAAEGVTVAYRTVDGTAVAGQDYTATAGTVYFASGQMTRTFTVPILNDTLDDDGEAFGVELEVVDGPGVTLGAQTSATVTIADNDGGGTLKFSAISFAVSEAGPVATITVARTGGAASGVTVDYATSDGTAAAGSDYTASSGTVTFGAGQLTRTFTVPIGNDTLDEANETLALQLSNPGGGAVLGAPNAATLTITDNDTAGAIRFGAAAASKSEGGGSVSLTVVRTGAASNVTVAYATSDGTATAGADYTAASGTLTFNAGQLSQQITVPILEDAAGEVNETFAVTLSGPTGGATLGVPAATTVTILENEAVLQFAAANYAVVEGKPSILVTVKRSGLLTVPVSVAYAVSGGTATDGSDFTAATGTLNFAAGVAARTFAVAILNDAISEPPETVLLRLGPATGGALGPQATSVLTITDNDALLQFSAATYTVSEAGTRATITVKRTGSATGTVGVDYATADGSAVAGADYTASTGTLTFGPGVLARTFTVPITNDTDAEDLETVTLNLIAPTGGAAIGALGSAVLKITDNDPRLRFSAATYSVSEGSAFATITVRRSSAAGTVSVDYTTSDVTATAGADYTLSSGTLTFDPGVLSRTFTVPLANDGDGEGNETVGLTLSNAGGGAALGTPSAAVLTILDNEPLLRFGAAAYKVSEAGVQATVTVTRSGPSAPPVSVDFTTNDGTATAGEDYTATSGTLAFGAGVLSRTFTVPVSNDGAAEGNETVALTLSNPVGAGLGTPGAAVLTILDNEPLLQFSTAAYTATELGLKATITVKRSGPATGTVGVSYATSDGTATAGADYTAAGGTLSFGPGVLAKTFVVPIANDTVDDNAETILLALSAPTGGAGLGTPSAATVTITDNDVAGTIQFSAATYSLIENGGAATITVSRAGGAASAASVDYATSDGSAAAGSDYTAAAGTLSFPAGVTSRTFTVAVTDDLAIEGNKYLNLTLSNEGGGAALGARRTAQLFIVENDEPGTFGITDVSVVEGNAGTVAANFTIGLSTVSASTVTVDWATADGTATTADGDYVAASGTVTFDPGETEQPVTVLVNGDAVGEGNETFFVNLSGAAGAAIADAQGQGTIQNDDWSLSINDVSVTEGNAGTTNAVFSVTVSPAAAGTITVNYATEDGSAETVGSDYAAATGTLSFTAGQTVKTITVSVNGDTAVEGNETFFVNLSGAAGATIADAQGQGTIQNDDVPSLSIDDVSVTEGDAGTTDASFTVLLSASVTGTVTVNYATANGTATTANADYVAASGQLTFTTGQTEKTVTVTVNGDAVGEGDETFFVNLSAATGATIADSQGLGTIENDDWFLSINNVSVTEGNAGTTDATFTVTLSPASPATVTVDFATADGTATTAGSDYAAASGTLTFTAGQTTKPVTVTVNGDAAVEGNETFFVDLSGATGATIADAQGQGTIQNDDCVADADADRLCDTYETNTGVYVGPTDTGTNPAVADTDGDSIDDGDEVLGTVGGLDLPGLGANPLRKNILLEYDWFDDNNDPGDCVAHSHRPTAAALARVSASFAAAPVTNPDGSSGITVIHDYGQGGAFSGGTLVADADGVIAGGVNNADFQAIKTANFATNRAGYFHYVLLPHRYDTNGTSSGQAELPGNDLIVSLYCYGTTENVSNTIMHELGHNLLLRHGGTEHCNWKPNYNSVMNYRFQFNGVDTSCNAVGNSGETNVLDYSHGARPALNENALNENAGVCGATAINWNFINGIESNIAYDLNRMSSNPDAATGVDNANCAATLTTLSDADDWANFVFTGLADADGMPLVQMELIDCENPSLPRIVPPDQRP